MDPYTRQRRFIDTLWPYAAEFETSTGIPASWAVAMAANETGWDADNPVLFGIKGKSLSGQGASFPTWEVEGGERVDTTSQFATYEGFGEAFQHLASEMGTERYKGAPKTSAQEFATYLQSQGWATDPEYAAKIGRLAGEVESLRPITAELGRRPPGVEDLLKPGPEEPTDVDDLLKIEREALSRVQVRDIARSYQDAQSYLATRAYTIQRQLGEAQQRLAIVQRPTRQDLLADIARVGVELSPRAHLGPLALVFFPPDLQPRYSPEHEKQVVEAAASVDLHLTELDRIALMQHFLAAAPAGWASGDWSEDFEASLQTFTGDAGLVDALEPGELEFLRSAWEAVTQMPRMMTEEQFAATTEALQAVPRARPVRAGLLSRDELIRSLTGRAEPGPLPRGVTSEAYLQMAARRGLSAEELSRLKDLQGGWRKYAEEYAIQRGAIEAYRAGMAQPQIKELSGWEYLKLGLVQPAYLGYEALVAWNQNAQSLIGTSMRYKTGYSPVLGTAGGALIGAGVGGAYGAVVGGAVGLGVGTWTKFTLTPELERQYQEVLRRNPSTSDWEAAGLAWQNIPGNDALKLIMEVVGDPTNVLGIGLGTRIFGRVSVLGKIFGAVDRGWMKFWDIATPPLVGALAGGVVTGEPWGAAAGAGLFTAMRVPVRTFTQSALRHSLQGASLLKVLAAETKRAEQGVFALPSPQPTAQDMLKVARLAAGTLRKDPTPAMHTNLHKLGLYVFQAGFRPPLQAVTAESSQMWRSVGNLAKALGRELPTGLQMHNIMDALWSNIGKGTYFTRDEIAQRIASTLGLDPLALAKKVGRRRDVTVGKLISVWVRRFEDNVFAEGMQAFKDRRVGGAKALEDWIDQLQNNTMEWFRHPSYRVAEAEGVWGGLRRFEDAVSRDRFFNAIDRFNYTMAKQALLFVSYGPWNVAENIIRMGLGGISPFGMWFKHPGTWLPTAMDVTHFLNAITADLTNVRPFVKFESERAMQTPVLMGAMPKSTQETMLGVRGKVLEGSDLPYGQRSAGLLHPLLDYLPGVSISLPGFLRDVLPRFGGERWAAALEASWLGRKLPEQFWSLRHFNAAFQDTGQKLQSWYLLNMFQRQLQQVAPDTYGRIMAAVGSPAEVPDLAKHLPLDVLRALHTKLTGYALYGDPDIIRGLRLTPQELTMVNLRQRLLKTLQGFPELGPQMQNAVLAAVETGELRPGMSPEKVQDFFHRLWAGWMDNTVVGRLEYQALAIEQVLQDLLAFSPQNADEMFRVVRYMGDVLQTADHSLSENLDFVADRGDQLSTKERHKLWGTSWAAAVHMAKKLDVEYKVAVRKINALLDGAANLPMDTSQSHFWSKGITGQATVAGKARSQTAVVEELAAQNRIKLWADSLPVDLRIGIRSVQVNPKATTPAQVLLADGTLRLELKSLATTQTEFHHAIASHLVGSKKILDAEFMDQVQKALPGTTDEQLTDALTQHLAGVDTPLRVLFDEHFPTRLPNLVLTSDQVRLMKQYNAHLISLADAYLPVRQAQQELHQKVYAKGGDPHLYPKYLPIVRAAWDKYQAIRAKAQTLMQATEIALGETYGLKVQPQVLRVPPSGTLTPSDVAYMWNQFPSQLIRDLIDPTTLQLTGRSSWTTKQMTRARRLVANTGKTLPDFGIDEEALGKVYDNLLVSIGLDPTNAKPWAASQAWFDGMRRDVLAHLSTVNIHPDASSALDKYLDDVARKLDEVFPRQAEPPAVAPVPSAPNPQGIREFMSKMTAITGPEGTRAVAGVDPRILLVLAGNLYSGDLGQVAVKEMIQNSLDALMGLPNYATTGRVGVSVNSPARTISVVDNGSGMGPGVLTKEFVDIGGSLKYADARGGFGIAKVAIFANSSHIEVRSVWRNSTGQLEAHTLTGSGEDWLDVNKGLELNVVPLDPNETTGTSIKVTLKPEAKFDGWSAMGYLNNVVGAPVKPANITIDYNGVPITPTAPGQWGFDPYTKLDVTSIPGSQLDWYVGRASKRTNYVNVAVHNHGMFQFKLSVYTTETELPERIAVDVKSIRNPEHPDYPFRVDREGLRKEADKAVRDYVENKLVGASVDKMRSQLTDALLNSPIAHRVYGQDLRVYDTTGRLDKKVVRDLASSPSMKPYMFGTHIAFTAIVNVLKQYYPRLSVAFGGIGVGKGYLGLNIARDVVLNQPRIDNLVLLNPYVTLQEVNGHVANGVINQAQVPELLARQTLATIIHEITHQQARGENEAFTGALTRNIGYLAREMDPLVQLLTGTLNTRVLKGTVLDDITSGLTTLERAWTEGDDLFGTVSISQPAIPGGGRAAGTRGHGGSGGPGLAPPIPGRGQGPPGALGGAPTPGGGLPRPGLAAWRNVRAEAMDQTNLQFARDFPDYDNMNLFDSFMRSIYPFWLYERERYPWTIRTFARRPAVALTWAKYMENSDDGYWQIPGTMLQANPLRGTVFAGGYSRLFRKDYPEYYDQFPQTPYEQISNLSRMGFYPNASYTIPEAVFGGAKPQTGGVLPPYAHTFLGSLNILPNHAFGLDLGHYKSVILDYIFPDRYRDYRVQQVLQDRSLDGIYIMNKRARGQPLTDAEQSAYNSARDYVLGVSGVLDSQFGMFRLRSEDRQRLYAAYTTAAFALSGVPPEAQERLRRRSAVTNTRLTDVLQLDPLDQWVMNQYLAPDSRSRNWLRPQTTPLLPSMYGEMQSRTLSYYDEVDKVWSNAREHGFPIYDREGNETSRTPSAQVLEQQFRSGKLKADDYTHQLAEVMRQAEAATKAIGETDYYRDLPKTRKQREDWLQLHGMPTPTYGPGQELLWEYYNLRPQVAPDEDGVMRYDWDMYYAQVDALLDALTPETRQRLLARIQAEWTDTQRLYWQVSREYLAGYRNIRNVVREQLDTEGQKVVERYYKADVAEKRRLEAEETSGGLKLISQYNQSVRQMRENLRLLDPDLDAWLLFWGKANKPLSEAATHRYNELLDLHRPGAEKIIWQ